MGAASGAEDAQTQAKATQASIAYAVLNFNIDDILPGDFLARICANMNMSVEGAQLGWKSGDDPKKAQPRRLSTDDDVLQAFTEFRPVLSSTRRTKPVYMEVINLVSSYVLLYRRAIAYMVEW